MTVLDVPGGHLIRFFHGEEIVSGLVAFAKSANLTAAWVQALGALSRAEIGYYDPEARKYERLAIEEDVEVTGLIGNLSLVEQEPFAHLHVTLGRRDFSTLGGHLFRGEAGATVEVLLLAFAGAKLERARDEEIGLNLWALPRSFSPPEA